ncbi:MAG: DUF5131 family protein [Clostridia bacterium]|nr:DUF5131 family protein [Clostridia bacterium]
MSEWNPWHGCRKISPGCLNCYVYRRDAKYAIDSRDVRKNTDFDLPLKLKRDHTYKLQSDGSYVYTCFTSDFFLEEADPWRTDCWEMIRRRFDLSFFIITKRIHRFSECIPKDWGNGYRNVTICCTVENEEMAKKRLPIFQESKSIHKQIICEPLLSPIDLSPYLDSSIEAVAVGGESGENARICDYAWVLDIRRQCMEAGVPFRFRQTGAKFLKDGILYHIKREHQHRQAQAAGIDIQKIFL